MKILIPNSKAIELKTLILDLNGTLTVHGKLVNGVAKRLSILKKKGLKIVLFSGDTRGNAKKITDKLGITMTKALNGKEKRSAALKLNPKTCVAVGNGLIDKLLFETVELSIATLQEEGVHMKTLAVADIVIPSVIDALDLLINEESLIATLRP